MIKKFRSYILICLLYPSCWFSQVNYASNGGFETCINCSNQPFIKAPKYWSAIDSTKWAFLYGGVNSPLSNLPVWQTGSYQFPRTGNFIIATTQYCDYSTCFGGGRGYPRNRLKQKLKANTDYCVTFYVNNCNCNTVAIDGFGAYFGNTFLDTITQCNAQLTYLLPQVQNASGNIIADTLNWVRITGTFTAVGDEKYLVLGNFKSNSATNTVQANPAYLPTLAADIYYDDVSVIELDLPAFAGNDTSVVPGSSVFLGRASDVGIDEACVWSKLPGSTPIDTVAGFFVNPTTTSTYVVVQTICGLVKSDTVVVHMDLVGLSQGFIEKNIELFPQPAQNELTIKIKNEAISKELTSVAIYDQLGQMIREEEINTKENVITLRTENLPIGIYFLQLKTKSAVTVSKKFLVNR